MNHTTQEEESENGNDFGAYCTVGGLISFAIVFGILGYNIRQGSLLLLQNEAGYVSSLREDATKYRALEN